MKEKVLHIGCGPDKYEGAIGLDVNPKSQADVIHDLNKFPYPFESGEFDKIIAVNVIEHLDNIPKVMEEVYRLLKRKGIFFVRTGHFSSVDAFTDPTHTRFFTSRSFDYFIPDSPFYNFHYADVKFKKIRVVLGPLESANFLLRPLLMLINKFPLLYESRFAFVFPIGVITYELEKVE